MFSVLMEYLGAVFDWIAWAWRECWRQACSVAWSIWSVVLVVFSMVIMTIDFLMRLVGTAIDLFDAMVLPNYDLTCAGARYYLEIANTFLPVSETFAFAIAYATLLGVLLLYRGLKSIKAWFWAGG